MAALRDAVGPEGPTSFASRLFGHSPIPSEARSWYVGLLGEQEVAERLRRLPEGWLVHMKWSADSPLINQGGAGSWWTCCASETGSVHASAGDEPRAR